MSLSITLKIPLILNSPKQNNKGIPSRDIKVKQISEQNILDTEASEVAACDTHEPELATGGCIM